MAERCGSNTTPTPNRGKPMPDNLPATSAPARTLGEFACGLTFEHIPAAVLERAKLLILDALGCGIASNAYGFSDAALASIIHGTAACLPTALTCGEELDVDGRVLFVAYAAGMETAIRVGAAAK